MEKKQKRRLIRILCSALMLGLARWLCLYYGLYDIPELTAYLLPFILIGYDVLLKAISGILHLQLLDENFLMTIATLGAFIIKDYPEAVSVMLFYQLGSLFESIAVGKSKKNIAALMDIRPQYANLSVGEQVKKVEPSEVAVNSSILVFPGEKIPLDGKIEKGVSTLDLSILNGESLPKEVQPGDHVFSGSVNLSGILYIRTEKTDGESTVSQILKLVEESTARKSKSENFISKFAKIYTPAVCIAAFLLAFTVPLIHLLRGQAAQWDVWLNRAFTFLAISCPCALVISVPLSFFGAIGCACKQGILIKGSHYFEALCKAKIFVFDKTGTLTAGSFHVVQVVPQNGFSEQEITEYAAYAESGSSHPLAQGVIRHYGKVFDFSRIKDYESVSGKGIKLIADGKNILCGNHDFLLENGIRTDSFDEEYAVVYLAINGIYAGKILLSDEIKEESATVIAKLKNAGAQKIIMLSGDTLRRAQSVGRVVGIDEVKASLLPQDKLSEVEAIIREKKHNETLAFIGDGINDAPVLTRADVGIAMGSLGSDAAMEAADVVLLDDDLQKIPLAIRICRKTVRIVRQNIVFCLLIKLVCLILGGLGLAGMWLAVFADVGVMILAVLNAARAAAFSYS